MLNEGTFAGSLEAKSLQAACYDLKYCDNPEEYYDRILSFTKQYDDLCSSCRTKNDAELHKLRKKHIILMCLVLLLIMGIAICIGIILGKTVFAHDVLGANTVCYITYTGNCYHNEGCHYLNSKIKTNVYKAKKNGYTQCDDCYFGPLDVSSKPEYFPGIAIAIIGMVLPSMIALGINLKKKRKTVIERQNKELQYLSQLFFSTIRDFIDFKGILKIVNASDDVFLQNGTIVSNNNSYYRYVSRTGNCYHSNPRCSKELYKVWAFNIKYLEPCYKCAEQFTVPEWYKRYQKIQEILKNR